MTIPDFYQQQTEGGEEEFADAADDADEHADVSGHPHLGDGHGKAAFSSAELEWQEEEQIGEEACEGKNEEGIDESECSSCTCIEEE